MGQSPSIKDYDGIIFSMVSANSTPFRQTFTYDPLGNFTSKSDIGSYNMNGDSFN